MGIRYPNGPGYNVRSTSKAAALEILPFLSGLRQRVFEMILENPRTCDEIEKDSHLSHQTASARVTELSKKGYIVPSGIERPTRSGRKAIVWMVPAKQTELPF